MVSPSTAAHGPGSRAQSPGQIDTHEAVLVAALNHAWDWVSLRTSHRIQVVNYFLLAIAFMSAGYVTALHTELDNVAGSIAIVGLLVTAGFWRSDFRAKEYIRAGERALAELEDRFAAQLDVPSVRILAAIDQPSRRLTAASSMFALMYLLSEAVFTAAAVYAYLR